MIKILTASILLMAVMTAMAQDKEATSLLNEVADKTQSFDQIKIEFEYKMINRAQGVNESLSGTLLSQGEKYNLNIAGQQIISDGKTVWTFLESVNEIHINEPADDDEEFNPRSFLANWSEKFNATMLEESVNIASIELLPMEPAAFTKAHAKVDKSKKQLQSITMFDAGGNEFVYSVKSFITGESIPGDAFTFDVNAHPGIEVIDLR